MKKEIHTYVITSILVLTAITFLAMLLAFNQKVIMFLF